MGPRALRTLPGSGTLLPLKARVSRHFQTGSHLPCTPGWTKPTAGPQEVRMESSGRNGEGRVVQEHWGHPGPQGLWVWGGRPPSGWSLSPKVRVAGIGGRQVHSGPRAGDRPSGAQPGCSGHPRGHAGVRQTQGGGGQPPAWCLPNLPFETPPICRADSPCPSADVCDDGMPPHPGRLGLGVSAPLQGAPVRKGRWEVSHIPVPSAKMLMCPSRLPSAVTVQSSPCWG